MKRLDIYKHRVLKGVLMAFVATAVILSGCGDGDDTFTGNLGNELRVIDIRPLNGETGVSVTLPIEIRMSAPMATGTVTGKLVVSVASNGSQIEGTTTFSDGDQVIVFNPNSGSLPGNSNIKVELQAGVQSITGQTLLNTFTAFFTTGTGSLANVTKPGEKAKVVSFLPGGDFIASGDYTDQFEELWAFRVQFDQCVTQNQLAANIIVEIEDIPLGLFPSTMPASVLQSAFDTRVHFIYLIGYLPPLYEVKVRILGSALDCDGDAVIAHTEERDSF